ncbi:MAG: hypothetical protein HONBIEJF_00604 [Fimbriimonadaceae bacterium]|nr:hypothetical protein [Fimbriimonadaceae bacterium]
MLEISIHLITPEGHDDIWIVRVGVPAVVKTDAAANVELFAFRTQEEARQFAESYVEANFDESNRPHIVFK